MRWKQWMVSLRLLMISLLAQSPLAVADTVECNNLETLKTGYTTYTRNRCRNCHGIDGKGKLGFPDLTVSLNTKVDHDGFIKTVTDGRPDTMMPAYREKSAVMTAIEPLYCYLKALSQGKVEPGNEPTENTRATK